MKRTDQQIYDDITKPALIESLKDGRDAARWAPITTVCSTGTHTFDMHPVAQENIRGTLTSFDALRAKAVADGWPDNGTFPWTLFDNSEVAVTKADLQKVHDEGALRVYQLHVDYKVNKAAL